jgi:hypothetical protein
MGRDGHSLKVNFIMEKNLLRNKRKSLFSERKLSLPEAAVWSDVLIAQQAIEEPVK